MNIEEENAKISSCRMWGDELRQYNNAQPVINEVLSNSVKKHREYNGVTSMYSILKGLVRTRKFCRTVKA